jgi:hypothetical protein
MPALRECNAGQRSLISTHLLGASYTLDPGPNYGLCTDPGDLEQLTDGMYTDGYFWIHESTVGWQEKTSFYLHAGPGCGAADTGRLVQYGGGLCGRGR